MTEKPRLVVKSENETGLNTHFLDTKTKEVITRGDLAKRINKGEYPDYHVAKVSGRNIIKSNPDGNKKNNLD
ncbi:DUF3892 domain-containing protein [Sporosarcina sp. E16_8]|uniref:DUF3892 domain-containing protein n=1 Tax=Sporosarcina sp. E16_8 TaxID=2789295 RepID=UPI001A929F09|nr:DUF3892 domain-containing protein [Sporosarcina sp. E16_8]MBO0586478.1 DUF3892 domain-containing protein [Sporosarcina sp. E16_8]